MDRLPTYTASVPFVRSLVGRATSLHRTAYLSPAGPSRQFQLQCRAIYTLQFCIATAILVPGETLRAMTRHVSAALKWRQHTAGPG